MASVARRVLWASSSPSYSADPDPELFALPSDSYNIADVSLREVEGGEDDELHEALLALESDMRIHRRLLASKSCGSIYAPIVR